MNSLDIFPIKKTIEFDVNFVKNFLIQKGYKIELKKHQYFIDRYDDYGNIRPNKEFITDEKTLAVPKDTILPEILDETYKNELDINIIFDSFFKNFQIVF